MSDPFEWEKPGKLYLLLQRYKANRKQINRGGACLECRRRRRKCDPGRPCKACILSKCEDRCVGYDAATSSQGGTQANEEEAQSAAPKGAAASGDSNPTGPPQNLTSVYLSSSEHAGPEIQRERGPERTEDPLRSSRSYPAANSVPFISATAEVPICQNLHEGRKWLRRFTDLGFNHEAVCDIIRNLPPKLSAAVARLDDRVEALAAAQTNHSSDSQAEKGSPAWAEAQRCASLVCKLNPDGTTSSVTFNSVAKALFSGPVGFDVVQMGVKLGKIPLPSSQYRYLCIRMHISWMFLTGQQAGHIFSVGVIGKQELCFRLLVRFFHGHTATCNVPLTPAEYNAAIAASPDANGVFLECARSATEFLATREETVTGEQIANMRGTAAGRAQLDRLADKLNAMMDTLPPLPDGSA